MDAPDLGKRYRIEGPLGEGGTGAVYRARDLLEDRDVAVKVFPASGDTGAAELARREFRWLVTLGHPNIVRVLDFGATVDGRPYFTMELLEGPGLDEACRQRVAALRGATPSVLTDDAEFDDLLRGLLSALDALHRRGILHLDLKPANARVVRSESTGGRAQVKLIDFGLARRALRRPGEPGGTAEYVAPEVIRGEAPSPRSDLYSLGIILYELLRGECPFGGHSTAEVLRAHLESPVPDLSPIPPRFRSAIERLLQKDPSRRPPSAWSLREELFDVPPGPSETWPPFEVAFVGREDLLRRLRAKDRPPTVLLRGERGSGKSRILKELKWALQLEGRPVLLVKAEESSPLPGSLVRQVLRGLSVLWDAEAETAALSEEIDRLVAPLPSDGRSENLSVEGSRDALIHRFVRWARSGGRERSVTLLVDAVERADTLSRDTIVSLIRALEHRGSEGLALVLAGRDDAASEARAVDEIESAARGFSSFRSEPVLPLDAEAVDAYLREVLGRDAYPEELVRVLVEQAGGNCFFIEEYLRLLVDGGRIRRDGLLWKVLPGEPLTPPASVEEALEARIGRLPEDLRHVLQWAAVVARPFSADELRELAGDSTEHRSGPWGPSLEALTAERLVRLDDGKLALASEAVRQVVDASMTPEERRGRHEVVASRLLASGSETDRLEEIANHLYLAGDATRARGYLERAGERARRAGALRESRTHLTRALELTEDPARRFQLLVARQEVLGHLGDREPQRSDLEELARLAAEIEDPRCREEAALREALYFESLGRKRDALDRLERVLADPTTTPETEARLRSRVGMLRIFLNEYDEGFQALEKAAEYARRTAHRRLEAECAQHRGLGHYQQGRYDAAIEELQRALSLFRQSGEASRTGALESNLGLVYLDRGDLEAAVERFKASLKVFHQSGLRRGEAINLLNLGLAYREMGRYERALDSIQESLAIRRELGDRRGEGADLGNLAEVWIRVGCLERAVALIQDALAIARELENPQSESVNIVRLGRVDLARGRVDEALLRFREGLELAERLRVTAQQLIARTGLAQALLEAGDSTSARVEAERAVELAARGQRRGQMATSRALLASTLLVAGSLEEADEASRDAVDDLQRCTGWLADAHDVWFVRYRVLESRRARGLAGGGPQGEATIPSEVECEHALRRAYVLLREKADAFADGTLRDSFLREIPLHAEIDRLHEMLQARVRREADLRERSFHEIAKSIHSVVELDPLLDRLLSLAIETTHAEKGLIALKNPDGSFTTRAARGMARESVDDATDICRSVIADVARGGGPILAADASHDDRFRERRSIITFHIRTLMCVPMIVRDEIVGAVYVDGRGASSFGSEDLDYLVSFSQLAAIAVDNVRLLERLRAENLYLRREVETRYRFENLIGHSPPMERLVRLIEKVAATHASVLICGETGTGKELVARAIHHASERKSRPFVAVDCGALPENLLESELFGHRRGAFSGAVHDRVGLFEEASGGTIFLDEITNTSMELQSKLLRVLQEGEIRRLGENQVRKVDTRVIAASNVDVRDAVAQRTFREDLYYRLNVVTLEVPPLRERRDDIPLLVQHFLQRSRKRVGKDVEGLTEEAMQLLITAPFKGNVRELENLVERAVILSESPRIDGAFLGSLLPPEEGGSARPDVGGGTPVVEALVTDGSAAAAAGGRLTGPFPDSLEEFDRLWLDAERAYLEHLVDEAQGNLSEAARRAQVRHRNTLISRLKKHSLGRKRRG